MTLLDITGRLTPDQDKTNLTHSFFVPEGVKRLIVQYEYAPKTVENREEAIRLVKACFEQYDEPLVGRPNEYLPLKNLITLSVDGCGSYVGAAHRQEAKQRHVISEEEASPGFVKTNIQSGEWAVSLNVHSLSCDVTYTLRVEGVRV